MPLNLRAVFLIVFLLFINNADAQESMMENVSYPFLEKLIAAAKTNYPKYKTFDLRTDIAKANVQKAVLDWFNVVSFSYVRSPDNTTTLINPSYLNGYQYAVTVNAGAIMQKPSAVRIAKRELDIARLGKEEYDLNIEASVQQRYFSYVEKQTVLNLKIKSLESADRSNKETEYKFEKGEITFELYNSSVTRYNSILQDKIRSETEVLIAKSILEEIIGVKLETIK